MVNKILVLFFVFIFPFTAFGAIAIDTTSTGSATATSVTVAHTVTGINPLLCSSIVTVNTNGDIITGVTYNGTAMTRVNTIAMPTDVVRGYMYCLTNPATGTHNIIASASIGTNLIELRNASFTGVHATNPTAYNSTNGSGTSYSLATTVNDNNSLILGSLYNNTGGSFTPDANTQTVSTNANAWGMIGSSPYATATGSRTIGGTSGTANEYTLLTAVFAPASETSTSTATSTATTTVATDVLGAISFQLGIIIVMIFLMVVGFLFNNMKQKRPWQG